MSAACVRIAAVDDAPPPLVRLHLLEDDDRWLPPSVKAIKWLVSAGIWGGVAAAVGVTLASGHVVVGLVWKGIAPLGVGVYMASQRAANAAVRRRVRKLARGVDLARLRGERAEGELVHVVGRVVARRPLPSLAASPRVVYRRLLLKVHGVSAVLEAGEDFLLVDGRGEPVLVEVAGSRLLPREVPQRRELLDAELRYLSGLEAPPALAEALQDRRIDQQQGGAYRTIEAQEIVVAEGDDVEIVGVKARVVDPTVEQRLERDTPLRSSLRSSSALPLLISPVARGARR
jgi:hypothetical protein